MTCQVLRKFLAFCVQGKLSCSDFVLERLDFLSKSKRLVIAGSEELIEREFRSAFTSNKPLPLFLNRGLLLLQAV
jgi:hypothetical protein